MIGETTLHSITGYKTYKIICQSAMSLKTLHSITDYKTCRIICQSAMSLKDRLANSSATT